MDLPLFSAAAPRRASTLPIWQARPGEIEVGMTEPEIRIFGLVGVMRHEYALSHSYRHQAGAREAVGWNNEIEGAGGEMAFAKDRDIYWNGTVGQIDQPDVGGYQVRTNASRTFDDTVIRPRDKNNAAVFVGVLSFCPRFIICGWIYCGDAKRDCWWRVGERGRPAAWWVPRAELEPIATLPILPRPARR